MPDTVDASARLPGTPLLVTPAPGSREAMPQTQLSFLGAPVADISALTVRGSAERPAPRPLRGLLAGRRRELPAGRAVPAGETVAVAGTLSEDGSASAFGYSFVVGEPDPIARLPEPGVPAGPPGTVWHFRLGADDRSRRR